MITRTDIDNRLRSAPFKPFKIHLSNGKVHEVRHPEMAKTTTRGVLVGVPTGTFPEDLDWQDYHLVSLLHIVQIDPVGEGREVPSAASDVPANAA